MIKNIVFDIGNVLVSFEWERLAKEIGFTDADIRILTEKIIGDRWDEFDRGVMSEEEALKYAQEAIPGLEEKFATLWHRIDEVIHVYPYVNEWMRSIKSEGYRIYLLSNFPKRLFEKESNKKFDFIRYTDGFIISSFVKMIKPDREIYECLLNTYSLKAEECVFLDDRKRNVDAAKAIGMKGIVFTEYEDGEKQLRKLLESNK